MNEPLMKGSLANWHTTLGGTALAASSYGMNVGYQFPQNRNEWANLAFSLLIQFVFMLMKDASTGSQPK